MREIKFRAWDKDESRFYYFEPVAAHNHHYWIDCEIQQYTGLKDKNGVEIYEGDIVYDLNYEAKGKIVWDNEGADYNLRDGHGQFVQAFAFEDSVYEVIGNIYENPELLNG